MRMCIAPHHDGSALGYPQIAVAQFDTFAFGRIDHFSIARVDEPGGGLVHDRFSPARRCRPHPLEIFGSDRPPFGAPLRDSLGAAPRSAPQPAERLFCLAGLLLMVGLAPRSNL